MRLSPTALTTLPTQRPAPKAPELHAPALDGIAELLLARPPHALPVNAVGPAVPAVRLLALRAGSRPSAGTAGGRLAAARECVGPSGCAHAGSASRRGRSRGARPQARPPAARGARAAGSARQAPCRLGKTGGPPRSAAGVWGVSVEGGEGRAWGLQTCTAAIQTPSPRRARRRQKQLPEGDRLLNTKGPIQPSSRRCFWCCFSSHLREEHSDHRVQHRAPPVEGQAAVAQHAAAGWVGGRGAGRGGGSGVGQGLSGVRRTASPASSVTCQLLQLHAHRNHAPHRAPALPTPTTHPSPTACCAGRRPRAASRSAPRWRRTQSGSAGPHA